MTITVDAALYFIRTLIICPLRFLLPVVFHDQQEAYPQKTCECLVASMVCKGFQDKNDSNLRTVALRVDLVASGPHNLTLLGKS